MTSGYVPLGAMLVSDRLAEPFRHGANWFAHGVTFGGHPVATRGGAREPGPVRARGPQRPRAHATPTLFRSYLERLRDLPIVGDVRGDGYFFGIELVKDKATKETFDEAESERAAARLPVQGAVRERACTAAPTTAATRSCSSHRR